MLNAVAMPYCFNMLVIKFTLNSVPVVEDGAQGEEDLTPYAKISIYNTQHVFHYFILGIS